jgi:hypothetical protein
MMPRTSPIASSAPTRAVALACALCLATAASWALDGASAQRRTPPTWAFQPVSGYSATLEQCTASAIPSGRAVTFTGEMVATPGTQRMGMRIELFQHVRGEPGYREVVAPGLGVWRGSDVGVKIYRYVKQITSLAAPAAYRAVVHFRWLGEKGKVLKRAELRTAKCVQPLLAAPEATS